MEFFGGENAIVDLNLVDEAVEALPGRIGSVTSVTTDDHRESVSCHGTTCTTGSLDSVHKDNLIGAIKLKRKVGPFTNRHDARITKIITPATVVDITFAISTDPMVKHGCVSGAVFLSEDHVVHIARCTIPIHPGHRGVDRIWA